MKLKIFLTILLRIIIIGIFCILSSFLHDYIEIHYQSFLGDIIKNDYTIRGELIYSDVIYGTRHKIYVTINVLLAALGIFKSVFDIEKQLK